MLAAILKDDSLGASPFHITRMPNPQPGTSELLIEVLACGVCRTDLHIARGELGAHKRKLIPGHQIVGRVVESPSRPDLEGLRVGVSWLASVDGTCSYCQSHRENLCAAFKRTGFDRDGGFAIYATACTESVVPIPDAIPDTEAAPLLCAGAIGYRSMHIADIKDGQHVGLYGYGSSARILMPLLQSRGCHVYVATRAAAHQRQAKEMGAVWVGGTFDCPPQPLDAVITFAPSGKVVIAALAAAARGGIVAINAVHLDCIPEFSYDKLLWGERQLRSVANVTMADVRGILELAHLIPIRPHVHVMKLKDVNDALLKIEKDEMSTSIVLVP
jgi:propanol-preferring alcohol dehydrogenase